MHYPEAIGLIRETYEPLPCHEEHVKHVNANREGMRVLRGPRCGDTLYDYILTEAADAFAGTHDHHLGQCPQDELVALLEAASGDLERVIEALRNAQCEDDGLEHDPETYIE